MTAKRNIIPIFIPHLGCPHDCVFCNQRKISGFLTPADATTVTRAITEGLKNVGGGETQVAFYGGSFTAIASEEQESLLNAALPFLNSGDISSLRVSTRPDCIDDEVISRLKRHKVKTVELGSQSMDEDVLVMAGRGHTAEDTRKAAGMLKSAGFEVILQMMTGLPGDSREKSLYTAEKIAELVPDGVRIYPTVVIKNTKLYDMWLEGTYREHTVDEAADLCAELLDFFAGKKIPVIRLGLNPTDDLSGGEAAAGAYHPAFGELVQNRRYLKKLRAELAAVNAYGAREVTVSVGKGKTSQAVGQHSENRKKLKAEFDIKKLKFCEENLNKDEIAVLNVAK